MMDRLTLHKKLDEVFPDVSHDDYNNGTILVGAQSTINDQEAFDIYESTFQNSDGIHPQLFNLIISAGWYIDYHDLTGDYLIQRQC